MSKAAELASFIGNGTLGSGVAEDKKIVFDGNAQDFHVGLDDSTDSLTIGLGSTLGTTSHMVIDANGHITKPSQPSFYVDKTDSQQSVGVNSDTTITYTTERYDVGSNFASSTFTAPVTGKYYLNAGILLGNPPTDAAYCECAIVTSNRRIGHLTDYDGLDQESVYWCVNMSCVVDMDANDTAAVRVYQAGGVDNTFVFHNSASSYFTGILIG